MGKLIYSGVRACPHCGHNITFSHGQSRRGRQRYLCPQCHQTFINAINLPYYRRRLQHEQIDAILKRRALGESLRSLSKTMGLSYKAVKSVVRSNPVALSTLQIGK